MYDDNAFKEFVQEKVSCGEIRPRDNIPVTTFGKGTTTTDKECTYTAIVKYKDPQEWTNTHAWHNVATTASPS